MPLLLGIGCVNLREYYSFGSIIFLKSFQTLWVVSNIKRVSNTRKLEKSSPHDIQLLSTNLKLVKMLMQETCGGPFKFPCLVSIPEHDVLL
jgi:hypothetical protein